MAIRLRWRNGTQNPSLCAIIENTFDVVRLVFWLWLWKNKLNKNIVVCKCPKPPFQNKIKKHVCSSYKKKNTEALKKGEIIKRPLLNHGFLQCFSFQTLIYYIQAVLQHAICVCMCAPLSTVLSLSLGTWRNRLMVLWFYSALSTWLHIHRFFFYKRTQTKEKENGIQQRPVTKQN